MKFLIAILFVTALPAAQAHAEKSCYFNDAAGSKKFPPLPTNAQFGLGEENDEEAGEVEARVWFKDFVVELTNGDGYNLYAKTPQPPYDVLLEKKVGYNAEQIAIKLNNIWFVCPLK